ncbi:MAG: hypothetical protein M1812_001651 [Candelaria pacifica]|nr:MAG: hypothetical protein M1812_001651 [Candelaria pacifica]
MQHPNLTPRTLSIPLFLILLLSPLSLAVNITLHDDFLDETATQTCINQAPGICCRRLIHHPAYRFYPYEKADFEGLNHFDIASVWETNTSPEDYASESSSDWSWSSDTSHDDNTEDASKWTSGCGGVVKAAKAGPGDWAYSSPRTRGVGEVWEGVSGANYVSGGTRMPFLQSGAVGMRAFLGGGGTLFESGRGAATFEPEASNGVKVGASEANTMIGTVSGWAQTKDWVYPGLIAMGGREYRQQGGGKSRIYVDGSGRQLDLSIYNTKPAAATANSNSNQPGNLAVQSGTGGAVICVFGKRCCLDKSYVEKAVVKVADVLYGVLGTMQGVGFCTS